MAIHYYRLQGSLFKEENASLSILGDSSQCWGGLYIYALSPRTMQNLPAEGPVTAGPPVNLLGREVGPVSPDPWLSFWMALEK